MKRYLFGCLVLIFNGFPLPSFSQQGPLFTQYIFNGLILNPAYAGYQENTQINTTYRSQWSGFPYSPKTFSVSGDGLILGDRLGLGLLFTNDQLGAQENLTAELDISYRLHLSEKSNLNFGLGVNLNQNSVNQSLLTLQQPEAVTSKFLLNTLFTNLRFGLYWYDPKGYLGLSLNDLRNIEVSPGTYYLGIHPIYYFTGGKLWGEETGYKIKSSLLIQEDFKSPTNLDLNLLLLFPQNMGVGIGYRSDIAGKSLPASTQSLSAANAVSFSVEIYTRQNLRIGYSFDYSLNTLADASQGSHEISLTYSFSRRRILDPTRKCYFF